MINKVKIFKGKKTREKPWNPKLDSDKETSKSKVSEELKGRKEILAEKSDANEALNQVQKEQMAKFR